MKSKIFPLVLLFVLSLVPLIDLIHPGLPLTHDGQDHVARIANFYTNLQEGNIVPRWAGNLNWGYGHPILMFLYPLPSYMASIIHFSGFSFVDSVKIVFGVSFILSALCMYLWLSEFMTKEAAIGGGLLYTFAPYRFVDLYVRGAIGEHVAFIFPPLILYFLLKLSKKQSFWYVFGGSLSLAGLVLSHNAISLMFLPIILFYAIFLLFQTKSKKRLYRDIFFLLLFGFGISMLFWFPAFIEGKYTLRDIVTKGVYANNFVSFQQLLFSPWSYGGSGEFSPQIGILQWFFTALSVPLIVYLYMKRNKKWIFLTGLLFYFIITIFLMTPASKFIWEKITILQKFQFPWRFLSISVFSSAVLGAAVLSTTLKRFQKVFIALLVVLVLLFNKDYFHPKGYLQKPQGFYTSIYNSTTDTGESASIWSVRFMEKRPKAHIETLSGQATIREKERKVIVHNYEVISSNNTRLRENTLYFPGWKVLVDGLSVPIEFQDPNNRGLMTFYVEKGKHTVSVIFEETKLRLLADIISGISLFALVLLVILRKRIWEA